MMMLCIVEDGSSESGDLPGGPSVTPDGYPALHPGGVPGDEAGVDGEEDRGSAGGEGRQPGEDGGGDGEYHCEACGSLFTDLTAFMAHRNYECLAGKWEAKAFSMFTTTELGSLGYRF